MFACENFIKKVHNKSNIKKFILYKLQNKDNKNI